LRCDFSQGVAKNNKAMRKDKIEVSRAAYCPAEFAAACGRHPTWTYRLLYSGKIHAITELGRILIPASELDRVLTLAQAYDPKAKPKPEPKLEMSAANRGNHDKTRTNAAAIRARFGVFTATTRRRTKSMVLQGRAVFDEAANVIETHEHVGDLKD
jgi:hypothetical protein